MNDQVAEAVIPDYLKRLDMKGKCALVVGAGQGIGRQAAHALAQAGATVCCVDNDMARATVVANELSGSAYVIDAREEKAVEGLVADVVHDHGRLDVVVDIVGMARFSALADATEEDWRWQFAMVLDHVRHLIRYSMGPLSQTSGSLTIVSSIAAFTGAQGIGPYAAAKAAVVSLAKSAAVELAPRGIRVNTVAPDIVLTPRMEQILRNPTRRQNFVDNSPLGRLATPSDVASAILFLSSDLASYITGQSLILDAGVGARLPYPDLV